jgi:hypothetical protein
MATAEELKQEIHDWYEDAEEPLIAAFTSFVGVLSWRRAEITLPSGIAKLAALTDTSVVFYVGEQLFRADKEPSEKVVDPGDPENYYTRIHDWEIDDLREVESVNITVVDYQDKDSTDAI